MNKIGRLLGAGKEADVYEYGEMALKLYRSRASKGSAFREAANLAVLEARSLPTPRIHAVGEYDGRWGVLMDRAPGTCFADRIASAVHMSDLETMAQLHRRIHEQPGSGLPSLKERLSGNIQRAESLHPAARDRLLGQIEALPDGDRVCHGDFHPWNIHESANGIIVLDWLDACSGDPAADVCRTYVLMHHVSPVIAADYVGAYARVAGLSPANVLVWLPVVAAARLAEGVAAENHALLQLAGVARD
ncbi:phosphotransferase family protein [Rhizobium sp. LjRoot254]|uniref:phosphotransferase family protein n=1 Tax=Rhizobium sp. LjRoot254 TaxID=3342297 RepID=UPI003ECCB47E